jgi:hypothetical protein
VASREDWLFVGGILGTVVVLAALPFIVMAWALSMLLR